MTVISQAIFHILLKVFFFCFKRDFLHYSELRVFFQCEEVIHFLQQKLEALKTEKWKQVII